MAVDTFIAYVGVYANAQDAEADYEAVRVLHAEAGLLEAYDAAAIARREDRKVKITKKHETPTRARGVLGGGVGLATGLGRRPVPVRRDRGRAAGGDGRGWRGARGDRRSCHRRLSGTI